jgi:hypothetical protein
LFQIYAGEKMQHENSWWYPTCIKHTQKDPYQENKVLYDDKIYLTHKKTRTTISINDYFKSPVSGETEGIHIYIYKFIKLSNNFNNSKNF